MNVWFIAKGPAGPHTLEEERAYQTADNLFREIVISVLGENLVKCSSRYYVFVILRLLAQGHGRSSK
jgi:hypothetical protein